MFITLTSSKTITHSTDSVSAGLTCIEDTKSFSGKVVLVTGASSGIGAATAILFAKEGANVAIVGRNQTKLKIVEDKIKTTGKSPLVIIADLAEEDSAKKVIKNTIEKYGRLDVLVNNAGFAKLGSVLGGDFISAYDAIMAVNVRAVIQLTTLAAPHLIAAKGNIVNISSVAALSVPFDPTTLPYCISKATLDHFTKGLAKELAPSVRVNSVNPGPVATDFFENASLEISMDTMKEKTALKRVLNSEEIADMVFYLAGEKAKGITGSIFVVDSGYLVN